jgi:2-iminobutanoate/2-iminopropanoate deaminase
MPDARKVIQAAGAPAAIGPYSHGVISRGLLFCSGQIGLDPASGELVEGGAGEQAAQALRNLGAVCEAAGARLTDAVRCTVYVADLAVHWSKVNAAYERFFEGSEPPARVTIGVASLPLGARVEVDAVVALPER